MHTLKIHFRSRILSMPTHVVVLLPDSVTEDDHKRKVLWFLHGTREDSEDIIENDEFIDAVKDRDLITVIPDGLNSDFADQPQFGTGYQFADFFFEELMPFIYHATCASEDPAENIISGYSMGGAAALMLGLNHPEKFGLIAPLGSAVRRIRSLQGKSRSICRAGT